MKKVIIFGATSAIAIETAKQFLNEGASLMLAARDGEKLATLATDLNIRSNNDVLTYTIDANDFEEHKNFFDESVTKLGGLDTILIAHGTLPDQEQIQNDFKSIADEFNTNALSVISLCTIAAEYFEKQKSGNIAVISSVAGDRGRQSNYIYGTAKGAVSLFLQGLRNRLYSKNVNVLTIKPGFVDTPMTADIPKTALFASPEKIAKGIINAIKNGKNVVYLPGFWRIIMTIIKLVPEPIFKKLKL